MFCPSTCPQKAVQNETRRECLKSELYLRLKRRNVFKIVKGGPFRLFQIQVVAKYQKVLKGGPFEALKFFFKFEKIFEKNRKMKILKQSHSAKQLERKDPEVPSGFVSYVKN